MSTQINAFQVETLGIGARRCSSSCMMILAVLGVVANVAAAWPATQPASIGPGRDPPSPDRGLRAPGGGHAKAPVRDRGDSGRGFVVIRCGSRFGAQLPRIVVAVRPRLPMTDR